MWQKPFIGYLREKPNSRGGDGIYDNNFVSVLSKSRKAAKYAVLPDISSKSFWYDLYAFCIRFSYLGTIYPSWKPGCSSAIYSDKRLLNQYRNLIGGQVVTKMFQFSWLMSRPYKQIPATDRFDYHYRYHLQRSANQTVLQNAVSSHSDWLTVWNWHIKRKFVCGSFRA